MRAGPIVCAVVICVHVCQISAELVPFRLAQGSLNPIDDNYLGYDNIGVYKPDYRPAPRSESVTWRDSAHPELIYVAEGSVGDGQSNDGFQYDHWVYNQTLGQWACLHAGQRQGVSSQAAIYKRSGSPGISLPGFPGMAYVYGGQYNPGAPPGPYWDGNPFMVNDRWAYNATSDEWKMWGDYQEFPYQVNADYNVCEEAAGPGTMGHHTAWTRVKDNSGWLYGPANADSFGRQEVWAFYPSHDPTVSPFCFRRMAQWSGGTGTLYQEAINVGPGAYGYTVAVVDNVDAEIVWIFGGRSFNNPGHITWGGDMTSRNELWRFNMTSCLWAFFGVAGFNAGTKGVSSASNWLPIMGLYSAGTLPASVAPHVIYIRGGNPDGWQFSNVLWSIYVWDGPPQIAWLGGDPADSIAGTVSASKTGPIGGSFDTVNIPSSRVSGIPLLNVPGSDYVLQEITGTNWQASATSYILEMSLIVPTWIVQPTSAVTGAIISPAPRINVTTWPREFTLPVNGVSIELFLVGNPTTPDNTPIFLAGYTATIFNNVATFPSLKVLGAGFGFTLGIRIQGRSYKNYSIPFDATCNVGCTPGYCVGAGLSYPALCRRCDESLGFLLNANYTACIPACPVGNYITGPPNYKSCQACVTGCAVCVPGSGGAPVCTQCNEAGGYTKSKTGVCVTECAVNEFNDVTATPHICTQCAAACRQCNDSSTMCTSCNLNDGFARDESGRCVNPCPVGEVAVNGICGDVFCTLPDGINTTQCPPVVGYGNGCMMQCNEGFIGVPTRATCGQSGANGGGVFTGYPSCVACTPGSYAASGDVECKKCIFGTTQISAASSVSDCSCISGYYEADPLSPGVCSECPAGAVCDGGHARPYSAIGYFQSGNIFIECTPPGACAGANRCNEGYEDYLCGKCINEWYHISGHCEPCGSSTSVKIAFGVILASLACLFLITVAIPLEYGHNGYSIASPALALSFVQITATFLQIRLYWPDQVLSILITFSALNLNLDIVSPECLVSFNFYDKLRVELLVPIAVFALFLGIFIIYNGIVWFRSADRAAAYRGSVAALWMFSAGFLLFLSLAYTFLAQTSLQLFACVTQPDGKITLAASPTNLCYDDKWHQALPLAMTGIAVYILVIPILIVCVYAYISRTYGPIVARTHPLINFAINKYRPKFWYFEIIVILRKLALVAVSTFVVSDAVVSAVVCGIILIVALVLSIATRPFVWDKHDIADAIATLGSLMVLLLGVVASSTSISKGLRDFLGNLSIAVVCFVGIALLLTFLLETVVRYRAYSYDKRESTLLCTRIGNGARLVGCTQIGDFLYSADEKTIYKWRAVIPEATTRTPEATVASSHALVGICSLGSDRLVSIALDGTMQLWNEDLSARGTVECVGDVGNVLCFAAGPDFIVTSHIGSAGIIVWRADAESGAELTPTVTHVLDSPVTAVCLLGETLLMYTSATGEVTRASLEASATALSTSVVCTVRKKSKVTSIAATNKVLLISSGFMIQGISMQTGEVVMNLPGHRGDACAVTVQEGHIVTGTWTGVVRVWDQLTGSFVERSDGYGGAAIRWVFVRNGVVYTANKKCELTSWQLNGPRAMIEMDPVRAWIRRRRAAYKIVPGPPLVEMMSIDDTGDLISVPKPQPLPIFYADDADIDAIESPHLSGTGPVSMSSLPNITLTADDDV